VYARKGNGDGKQAGLQPPAQAVAGHEAHSQRRRQVFELSRYEGKKYSEIAQELGISVNMVKYHIKNAIKILPSRISADVLGVLVCLVGAC